MYSRKETGNLYLIANVERIEFDEIIYLVTSSPELSFSPFCSMTQVWVRAYAISPHRFFELCYNHEVDHRRFHSRNCRYDESLFSKLHRPQACHLTSR